MGTKINNHIVYIVLLAALPQTCLSFTSLKEIMTYMETHDEYPDSDEQMWKNPNYSNYHKRIAPSVFETILEACGIIQPLWSFNEFAQRLIESVHTHTHQKNIVGIAVATDTTEQLIVIGDLFGSFFSLARICKDLFDKGMIDETLTIIAPHTSLLFLGNLMGASPYCLETLTVLLMIQKQNPTKAIFLRGLHEDRKRWFTESLFWEMEARSKLTGEALRVTNHTIDEFFKALPRGCIISCTNHTEIFLCIPADALNELNPEEQQSCLQGFTEEFELWCGKHKDSTSALSICTPQVIMETRRAWDTVFPTPPLTFVPPTHNKPGTWRFTSGQTRTNRQLFRSRWEGYVLITIPTTLQRATLELQVRPVNTSNPLHSRGLFNLISGQEI